MTADNFIKAQVVTFAYHEAKTCGGFASMLAVATILRNRVKAGWGDWLSVLNNAHRHAAHELTGGAIDLGDEYLRRVLMVIDDVYQGNEPDTATEGGLYYIDTLRPAPRKWFIDNIIQHPTQHPRVAQVGMLHIYR